MTKQISVRLIKFTSGQEIIATFDDDNSFVDGNIIVTSPVDVAVEQYYEDDNLYETYSLKPWMPLTDEKVFIFNLNHVLCINRASEAAIDKYSSFLKHAKKNLEKTEDTNKLYHTAVNSSRYLH